MPTESAGQRIRNRRQILGMTQRDLAARLGVSPSTVANWETGKHLPRRYIGLVEELLGISLSGEPQQERHDGIPDLDGLSPPVRSMVTDNYWDEAVRVIWSRNRISRDARLGIINWYVNMRDAANGG